MSELGQFNKQNVSGHSLAYYRTGIGEPVLLVHGITTYSFIWRRIVPLLKSEYDVISVDLLGCGKSDKPLNMGYSIKVHAELLQEFVLSLGIKKVHLVGHDVGGGIAQRFAVEYPELLSDLIIANGVGYDFWPVQPIISMRTPIIRQLAMATLEYGVFKQLIKHGMYHKDKLTQELMDLFIQTMKTKEGRKAFLHFAKSLNNQDLIEIQENLRRLELPVLIIRGDADPYLSSEIAQKLHREIPGSQLEIISTASHFIQEDEPVKFAESILNFFRDNKNAEK